MFHAPHTTSDAPNVSAIAPVLAKALVIAEVIRLAFLLTNSLVNTLSNKLNISTTVLEEVALPIIF